MDEQKERIVRRCQLAFYWYVGLLIAAGFVGMAVMAYITW